jgi:hypothetical protein
LYFGELGHYVFGLVARYNGGCIRNGEWYPGEEWQLPKLAAGFEIVVVPTWGYRIVKQEQSDGSTKQDRPTKKTVRTEKTNAEAGA